MLRCFLGMEFGITRKCIFLNQRKYIIELLGETCLLVCKVAKIPIEPNLKSEAAKDE